MRITVTLIALLAGCAGSNYATGPTEPAGTPAAVRWAVEHSLHLTESGCSAVRLGYNRVLTAKHCLPDDATAGETFETGVLTYVSPDHDFAVFFTPDSIEPVEWRTGEMGEHLYVVGYPVQHGGGGQKLTITDGVLAGPIDSDEQERITAPVYFGNSGGGVWGDDGRLLGIAVSIYAAELPGQRDIPYVAQSFMVPQSVISPWL